MTQHLAQIVLPVKDVVDEIAFFETIGFRLENIYPDDSPKAAIISGNGLMLRLDQNLETNSVKIEIRSQTEQSDLHSPSGHMICFIPQTYKMVVPQNKLSFEVRTLIDEEPWVIGRAGMLYRDLLPSRGDGAIMVSHIRIPNGGPVPDLVHYHTIGFQLIYCYKGWVKLVYEDQGEPFILKAGDCVNQPPEIRHRVLESSDNLEVIEIGVPAAHMTSIDHEMELPNTLFFTEKTFKGQKFRRHMHEEAKWQDDMMEFEIMDTGMREATAGLTSVEIYRAKPGVNGASNMTHSSNIYFGFILQGNCTLALKSGDVEIDVTCGEAFVIPEDTPYKFLDRSDDLEILIFSLGDLTKIPD